MSKDGEADEEPNNILEALLQALLKSLRSEMLAADAPRASAEDEVWERGSGGDQNLDDGEETGW